jgi:Ca2+-binding RTX toxin-like protein
LPDSKVKITDSVADRDGTDILTGVEQADFAGKVIPLLPGQDLAFVIDTTGSMGTYIDAVKARASEITNAVFDGDRGLLNSRVAVAGYNDPGANTFLSFTEQPTIDDRKTAVINAINSITVGGGGDIPEAVNAGLIRALNGDVGTWRKEAPARRIILFGDAPPKDTDLRAQVLQLAAAGGVQTPDNPSVPTASLGLLIEGNIETSKVTDGLAVTRFTMAAPLAAVGDAEPVKIPVEIFTVVLGNDPATRSDFGSLATSTGGLSVEAADTGKVVDALLAAIKTPIKSIAAINGTESDDLLNGTPRNDLINGLGGNDTVNGNEGDDIIDGGVGNDSLFGNNGNDTIIGGEGVDNIYGGEGDDSLTGGVGCDTFYFDKVSFSGVDTITDFVPSEDRIGLSKAVFSVLQSSVGNGFSNESDFAIVADDAAAATSCAFIVYNSANGKLLYNQDGATVGLGTGGQIVSLSDNPTLTSNNFTVV